MEKDNRGGRREGAGRKPETLSQRQVALMLKTAKKWAAEQGKTVDDILLGIIYKVDANDSSILAAIKLFKDHTMATMKEGGDTDRIVTPQVFVPEKFPDSDEAPDFEPAVH